MQGNVALAKHYLKLYEYETGADHMFDDEACSRIMIVEELIDQN